MSTSAQWAASQVGTGQVDGTAVSIAPPSAARSLLDRQQTTRELATALKEGGIESTSDNFENIVTTALNRLKAAGEVLRFKDGWALAEFYPENLRNRITKEQDVKATKRAKAKKRASTPVRPKAAHAKAQARKPEQRAGESIDTRAWWPI